MNELEQKILAQINKFRKNPKSFFDKSDKILQKDLNVFYTLLNSLNKISELELNEELSNKAKEEAKKLFEDPGYNKFQIGEEFQPKLSENFSKKESALLAIDGLNDVEDLIPKIILNSKDKEKKGRKILSNSEYNCLGIGCFILEENKKIEETSYVLIFSKDNTKENKTKKNITTILEMDNEELQNITFNELKNNISQIKLLSQKFGDNSNESADYMSNLLREQFRKIYSQDCKLDLLKLAFESDELIQRSLYLIDQTIKLPFPILQEKKGKKNNKHTFETKEECEKFFLNFIEDKKEDKILSFFEKIKSHSFNQVLLYYFELNAIDYFNGIKNKYKKNVIKNVNSKTKEECIELVLERNLLYLNKALDFLDKTFENKNLDESNLNNLGKIYSIAYIKLYMNIWLKFLFIIVIKLI